ncbi:pilus assembly protein TadE [Rothia nasimurium]|uniref:pilus assembly protein TadE n=1 Tax=Rothia nasimurium TaxID=85336 RepID=UPI001F23F2A7|nr:pilus assembly protein TadE [Rothia nasimurium]
MLWFSGKSNSKAEEMQRTDHPEQGSALVEFIGLGALLMVPTVYFLLSVFAMQSAAFAASNASSHALQVIQFLPPEQRNQSAVQTVAALTAGDFGLDANTVTATLSCEDVCAAGERMSVDVTVEVGLPLVPWPGAPTLATMTSQAVSWGGDYS